MAEKILRKGRQMSSATAQALPSPVREVASGERVGRKVFKYLR